MEDYERAERELLEHCGRVAILSECFAWLERCNECIESLECRAKRPRLTVGHRQSAVARIARLVDASSVVLERVRGAIDTHGSVKVNTAFNGEFVAGDKRTVMGINGKNCELYRCTDLRKWSGNEKLERHSEDCQKLNTCAIRLPDIDDKWLEFSKHCRKERAPFVVYVDLECVLKKTEDASLASSSYAYQRHEAFSIAYYVHCSYDNALSEYECRRGNDCVSWFANQLEALAHRVKNALTTNRPMDFTRDDWRRFDSATHCHICERPFAPGDERARDHCHLTGRYRGPAHKGCNVNYKDSPYVPVVFHNLSGYDAIEFNTQFRTRAENDFEKNLYKLINNAMFGKTMENVRERVDVKLVTAWEGRYGAEALIAKPNFHSRSVFTENLIAVELRKLEVKFDKPIYVGMCILDISKTCLYEFHHEYMTPLFHDRCEIMYTDTDSLIYRIECDDVYETMKRDIDRFDTSGYPANNAYGMPLANKKVPGLMKDENNGVIMTEFVGLRAKMYALRVDGKRDTKKAKGVKDSVVARTISFEDYTQCLKEDIEMTRRQACIRSKLHRVYTVSEKKIALSPYDDKRYVVPDSTNTLPWGHYRIV
ncbi:hypothetical protein ALC62_04328 [Cyphomyrmex costatus]|uniref:DNA-directed DNA polymerase n=1 Tax=Cyphomyrmex costatus TaxID=456900 RepID=A0A151IKQ4_9HYME|nr:hypothetical protein ALC62_04328 [Cyphomyrmex costatus]